ncbi:hypothetical protein AOLI_G00144570 [Acnodon oligacanthus]
MLSSSRLRERPEEPPSRLHHEICFSSPPEKLPGSLLSVHGGSRHPKLTAPNTLANLTEFSSPTDGFQHEQMRFTDLVGGELKETCFGWFCERMNGSIVWVQRYH